MRDWQISQQGMDADLSSANIFIINESLRAKMIFQEFTLNDALRAFGPIAGGGYGVGLY